MMIVGHVQNVQNGTKKLPDNSRCVRLLSLAPSESL